MTYSDLYSDCRLCPRKCGVNRLEGEKGFCGESDKVKIASAVLHKGEEPPLIGQYGSGTIFFTGCTLKCSFCQNYQISKERMGRIISVDDFSKLCLKLQENGAANINIVTGTHFIPSIIRGLIITREDGLRIPVIWNSSGYESVETLIILEPYIDIFLPDIKTLDKTIAENLFQAEDYPENIKIVLEFMTDKKPLLFEDNQLKTGVIVRHLVLPGELESSRSILKWFSENIKDKSIFSLMVQYVSNKLNCFDSDNTEIKISNSDYEQLLSWLDLYKIEEGFIQESGSEENWLPDFSKKNPFLKSYSRTIWHWNDQ